MTWTINADMTEFTKVINMKPTRKDTTTTTKTDTKNTRQRSTQSSGVNALYAVEKERKQAGDLACTYIKKMEKSTQASLIRKRLSILMSGCDFVKTVTNPFIGVCDGSGLIGTK